MIIKMILSAFVFPLYGHHL